MHYNVVTTYIHWGNTEEPFPSPNKIYVGSHYNNKTDNSIVTQVQA